MKKLMSTFIAFAIISSQVLTVSAYANEAEPQVVTIDSYNQVNSESVQSAKEKELLDIVSSVNSEENKKIYSDFINYEESMKNAKTVDEVINLRESMAKYVVSEEITYPESANRSLMAVAAAPGDTRITSLEYTAATHAFSNAQSSSLQAVAYNTMAIAIGWFHPIPGVVLSAAGMFISEPNYSTVTGLVISNVHVYNYTDKIVEVYRYNSASNAYRWEPMATSQYRQTKPVITMAQWKLNNVSQPAKVLEVGIVRAEQGSYFYDNNSLVNLAKAATTPLYYGYQSGPAYDFQPRDTLKY